MRATLPALPSILVLLLPTPGVAEEAPSFRHEVVPLLTRYGCNQGACHGKLSGQNGFRLSLRGYAPEWDHGWITREMYGRRVNPVVPEQSLLLTKPLGRLPHGGGTLFDSSSPAARLLARWIENGSPGLKSEEPILERLAVSPTDQVLAVGEGRQVQVQAHFSDRSAKDVTWLCQFFSSDDNVLQVSADGMVKSRRAGEAAVRVHYQDQVAVVTFTVPYSATVEPERYSRHNNFIDEHVFDKLARLRIPPSPLCDDATFLRRAFLTTIGTLPTPEETGRFLNDDSKDKREKLIDDLLDRPEFVDYWALQLADLLQNRKERDHDVRGVKGVRSFHAWLRKQVAENRPWDKLARDVLLAKGSSVEQPQVGYFIVTVGEARQAEESEVVESTAQAFLGTRITCAKCHNHPLEKYTQDDYYHYAAFFSKLSLDRKKSDEGATVLHTVSGEAMSQLRRKDKIEEQLQAIGKDSEAEKKRANLERQVEEVDRLLTELQSREPKVRQPRTGSMLSPRPLDRAAITIRPGQDPREALADWMTDPANEYFSGNIVNRVWKHFMGVGLVEPVDDLRPSNPPSNRALWDALNRELVESRYDLRHLMRLILRSRAFQLGSDTLPENAWDHRFYSHFYARRLQAEVALDAVCFCTGRPYSFPGYPLGLRAIQVPDIGVDSYFLEVFGRPARVTSCACERTEDVSLAMLLHLLNGEWIPNQLRHPKGRLAEILKEPADAKLVEDLFLLCYSRRPTPKESDTAMSFLKEGGERGSAAADLFWALLNNREFIFNH